MGISGCAGQICVSCVRHEALRRAAVGRCSCVEAVRGWTLRGRAIPLRDDLSSYRRGCRITSATRSRSHFAATGSQIGSRWGASSGSFKSRYQSSNSKTCPILLQSGSMIRLGLSVLLTTWHTASLTTTASGHSSAWDLAASARLQLHNKHSNIPWPARYRNHGRHCGQSLRCCPSN